MARVSARPEPARSGVSAETIETSCSPSEGSPVTRDRDPRQSAARSGHQPRRVLVLGANGPSGRQTVQQGLNRGLQLHALTRHPDDFPIQHERLLVIGGDATDSETVDSAVSACDAVISVIGSKFTWRHVEVYSSSARNVVAAMERHGTRRLVVVTSGGVPSDVHHGGLFQHLSFLLSRKTFTRTVYDDMEQMERVVRDSRLDWTIVRPPVLSDVPGTSYSTAEDTIDGPALARADLAAMLLDQLHDDNYLRKIVAVATPGLKVDVIQTIRQEFLKR